jgi:hypothetical protein
VRAAPSGGRLRLGAAQAGLARACAGPAARRVLARGRRRHVGSGGAGAGRVGGADVQQECAGTGAAAQTWASPGRGDCDGVARAAPECGRACGGAMSGAGDAGASSAGSEAVRGETKWWQAWAMEAVMTEEKLLRRTTTCRTTVYNA